VKSYENLQERLLKEMKIKKIMCLLLVIALLFSVFGGIYSHNDTLLQQNQNIVEFESRIFANATIDEDFCGRVVLVVMDKNVGGLNKRHDTSFFGDFPIENVVDLTARTDTQVAELEEAVRTNQQSSEISRSMENFRQILQIELPIYCKQNVLDVIAKLECVDGIVSAEPNFRGSLENTPPNFNPNQWALTQISTPRAWNINTGQNVNVRVGIIDAGISDHVDFNRTADNNNTSIVSRALGRAFIRGIMQPPGTPTGDDGSHGTSVSGVVATAWNGVVGSVNGVSGNVTLVPLKVNDGTDTASGLWVNNTIAAINYAATTYNNTNTRIRVLNVSLSWNRNEMINDGFNAMQQAIRNYPGLLVAAAGNQGIDNDGNNARFPASFPLSNVISVGATNNFDVCVGLNVGANSVHLFAPGCGIITTATVCTCCNQNCPNFPNHPSIPCTVWHCPVGHCIPGGTSIAAPHVAGVAALILNRFPHATIEQVKWAILEGTDRGTSLVTHSTLANGLNGRAVTGGRLNAHKAVQAMQRLQDVNNHDMTYGVHHIRSLPNTQFGTQWLHLHDAMNNGSVRLSNRRFEENSFMWVVQRVGENNPNGNIFQLRSALPIGNNIGRVRNTNNNAVISTATDNTNIIVQRNMNDGTVSFRLGDRFLTVNGTGVASWTLPPTGGVPSNLQRWILEPHRLTHQRGMVTKGLNINQAGGITNADRTRLANNTGNNGANLRALEFFLADVNRDGRVNNDDLTHIDNFLARRLSVLDGWIPSIYRIRNVRSGHLLDVVNAGQVNHTRVQQRIANGESAQHWIVRHEAGGAVSLTPAHAQNMRLDVAFQSDNNGAEVMIWQNVNNGTGTAQRFMLLPATGLTYRIMPVFSFNSGKHNALRPIGNQGNSGDLIELNNTNDTNQHWVFERLP
jgi:hypothetical protein